MLEALRTRLARMLMPKGGVRQRMYGAARASRLSGGTVSDSSADQELSTSLTNLRGRSRALVRDASIAKRAKVVVVNNVIGPGIGLQGDVRSTRGELSTSVNDAIEEAFGKWSEAENCHTGGTLHFADLERAAMSEVFEAGEAFIRIHPLKLGRSSVPLALELVEAERVCDDVQPGPISQGNMVRMGVEVDRFYRPVRYWMRQRHRGEFRLGVAPEDRYEPVPADQVIHLRLADRWPQTRGVPWLHTTILRLQDIDGYAEAEITAARGAASYMASIETPDDPRSPAAGVVDGETGERSIELSPGLILHLTGGEQLKFHAPNRPNAAMDPFMRAMLREIAAGTGVSYESLSRDYSQSNYSSSRLALLDDRDLWRFLQQWFIRSFRVRLHREFLMRAVLSRAVAIPAEAFANDMDRYLAAKYKPRGWSWIDPEKEVAAAIKAVRAGFTDVGDVIAKSADGRDLEDVLAARERELQLMREHGLKFDTDPENKADGSPAEPPAPAVAPVPPGAGKPKDAPDAAGGEDDPEGGQGSKNAPRSLVAVVGAGKGG